ncbi:MAG TPA: T9SS type A sorting domain-containing protein [Flavobacteriales bacterium]|nr:T9SS type A sorting domain-containing protein [Flavobacteriales bacterium]HIO72677.1 T9SS type A sorting domain-containing protein [Flavobacteriales bacterium]
MKLFTLTVITTFCYTVSFAQAGDDCNDPIIVYGASGSASYTTTGFTHVYTSNSGGGTGKDIVYALNTAVPQGGTLHFWTTANDYDVVLYGRYINCTAATNNELAYLDDPDGNVLSWVNGTASSQNVWLFVDGYGGNSGSATLHWDILTSSGVKELMAADHIKVYPNPSADKFVVEIALVESRYLMIKLLNVMGQSVYDEGVNENSSVLPSRAGIYKKTIDVGNFASGIYTLQLITEKGITNKKVIVK